MLVIAGGGLPSFSSAETVIWGMLVWWPLRALSVAMGVGETRHSRLLVPDARDVEGRRCGRNRGMQDENRSTRGMAMARVVTSPGCEGQANKATHQTVVPPNRVGHLKSLCPPGAPPSCHPRAIQIVGVGEEAVVEVKKIVIRDTSSVGLSLFCHTSGPENCVV